MKRFFTYLSVVQGVAIIGVFVLTALGFLKEFDYDGDFTLFLFITGIPVWVCSRLSALFALGFFPQVSNGWLCVILVPGLFNILFVIIQNSLLYALLKTAKSHGGLRGTASSERSAPPPATIPAE